MYTATILLYCSVGILFLSTEAEGKQKLQQNNAQIDYFAQCRFGNAKGTSVSDTDKYAMQLLGEAVKTKQISISEVKGVEKESNTAGNIYNFDITARNVDKTLRCCASIQEKTKKTKTNCPVNG